MEECARMNCDKEAVALLTFAPQQAKAWLYDLTDANPAAGIMLCRKHANATVVPMSWQLVDARDPAWPGPAPAPVLAPAAVDASAVPAAAVAPVIPPPGEPWIDAPSAAASTPVFDGPVTPQPYAEPREATLRAAGVLTEGSLVTEARADTDLSLFQLPLADVPAVTPHPDHH